MMKDFEGWHTNSWTAEKEAVLKHFGYDWESLQKEGPVGIGLWPAGEAMERIKALPDFMEFVDGTKKARVIFEYDPDFPTALLITQAALKE